MELKSYLTVLGRRKWVVVLTVLLVSFLTALASREMVPRYAATATLWVPASSGGSVGNGDILLNDRLINTYAELATSYPVLLELQRRLDVAPAEVRRAIKARSVAQTELLQITVQDTDPRRAADIATNLAQIVIAETRKTETGRSLRVSLFATASVPRDPTWLGLIATPYWREINVALAFVISLAAGVALAFLFEYLDTTLYTQQQIEAVTTLATLGEIPVAVRRGRNGALDGHTLDGEAFHFLRASLFFDPRQAPRVVLITSALSREGKSTVVANLARRIACSGHGVIVIDANMRRPVLHTVFGLSTEVGLSQLLSQQATLAEALQRTEQAGLRVITSGKLPPAPADLLDSPCMAALLEELKQQAAFILIDTPALLTATDAALLAPLTDGVVLVVERALARREEVGQACRQLGAVKSRLLGIVVNRAQPVKPARRLAL